VRRAVALAASLFVVAACGGSAREPGVAPSAVAARAPAGVASPPDASDDPAGASEGNVTVAGFRGMQIVVERTPGAELVAAQLYIRGGARNWTAATAGIEALALEVATTGGTRSLDKPVYDRKLASLGASVTGTGWLAAPGTSWSRAREAANDYSRIEARAPLASWDALFPVFVDTFLAPALPRAAIENARQRELAQLRGEMEDGDGRLARLVRAATYAGHPYANPPGGTEETLGALKAEDLAAHLVTLRDTGRLVLVVVGDVDPARVIGQARAAFASVPRGAYVAAPVPPLRFAAGHLTGDAFDLPTSYVESHFAAPAWGDRDFPAFWLGMELLGWRVAIEVRARRALSYAASAGFARGSSAPFGMLYVTAGDPNAAMKVMFAEAHRLGTEPVSAKELDGIKSTLSTSHLQEHESVEGRAAALGEAILVGGDWHLASTSIARIQAVTPEAVRAAVKRWFVNVQTVIVGAPAKLEARSVEAR
jgi:zinc protease